MLTTDDCDVILDALNHAKLNVNSSKDNLSTRHKSIAAIESVEQKVRAIKKSIP